MHSLHRPTNIVPTSKPDITHEFYYHYLLCCHQAQTADAEAYAARKHREHEERDLRRIDAAIREKSRYGRNNRRR